MINLDDTVAITQNFCSRVNFPAVWQKTRVSLTRDNNVSRMHLGCCYINDVIILLKMWKIGRKKMSTKWLQQLENSKPNLASIAIELNKIDGFVMYKKSKQRVKERKEKKMKMKKKEHGCRRTCHTVCTFTPGLENATVVE